MGVALLLLAMPGYPTAQAQDFAGVGQIKAGDTVAARREALDNLMRAALRASLDQVLDVKIGEKFGSLLEENLVSRAAQFVRNYTVQGELSEGTSYRMQARVDVNQDKLLLELKRHGFAASDLARPRLRLDMDPLLQTNLAALLAQLQFQLVQGPVKSSATAPVTLAPVALSAADYVISGTMPATLNQGELLVVRVEDQKFVGQVTAPMLQQKMKMDQLLYIVGGMVMSDWMDRWQIEQRVLLHITGVDDVRTYSDILAQIRSFPEIQSVQEQVFARNRLTLRLGVQQKAIQVLNLFRRKPEFINRFGWLVKDERTLEAQLK